MFLLLLLPPPLAAAAQSEGTEDPAGQEARQVQLHAPHPLGLGLGLELTLSSALGDPVGVLEREREGEGDRDPVGWGLGDPAGVEDGLLDGSANTPSSFRSNRMSLEEERKLCTSTASTLVPDTRVVPGLARVMMLGVVSALPSTAEEARVVWLMRPVGMFERAISTPFK